MESLKKKKELPFVHLNDNFKCIFSKYVLCICVCFDANLVPRNKPRVSHDGHFEEGIRSRDGHMDNGIFF